MFEREHSTFNFSLQSWTDSNSYPSLCITLYITNRISIKYFKRWTLVLNRGLLVWNRAAVEVRHFGHSCMAPHMLQTSFAVTKFHFETTESAPLKYFDPVLAYSLFFLIGVTHFPEISYDESFTALWLPFSRVNSVDYNFVSITAL